MKSKAVLMSVMALASIVFVACTGVATTPGSQSSSSNQGSAPATAAAVVHKMHETVSLGYTSYMVSNAEWTDRLSDNQFLDEKPNASYLVLTVTVRNDDKAARTIPPFTLVDESNATYESTGKAWRVKDAIGVLDSLNPNVSQTGKLIFDVPPGPKYRLKVSGGYWSGEDTLVEIDDPASVAREQNERLAEQKRKRAERQELEKEAADKAKWRTWTAQNKKFTVEAKFIRLVDGVVTFEKQGGKTIEVKLDRLCDNDQDFINNRRWLEAGRDLPE